MSKVPVLPELLLIDKPKGITSFDVIRQLRKKTGVRKFGHAGTLDPLATGLMLLGVGSGTKLLTGLVKLDKEYVAEILVGESRSTGDMEGEVVEEKKVTEVFTNEHLTSVLDAMVGTLTLPVSTYSAIKVDGKAMYKRAREAKQTGKAVDVDLIPVRDMKVFEAEFITQESNPPAYPDKLLVTVRFKVGSGTYVRSLAEEFGKRLQYPATLANLRRTQVGEYRIEDARKLEEF